jgi:hypothetical protein
MPNATKTWKIGEYCKGGVITVEIKGKVINIIAKEWDYSTGSKKSSNQSQAKEFSRCTVMMYHIFLSADAHRMCDNYLNDLTTSYYSDQILDWIKLKLK